MNRTTALVRSPTLAALVAAALVVTPTAAAHTTRHAAPPRQPAAQPAHVPGQLVVGYRSGVPAAGQSAALGRVGGRRLRSFGPIRAALVAVPGNLGAAMQTLERDPRVRYVEPNYVVHASALPNDPLFKQQWALNNTGQVVNGFVVGTPGADIRAANAWAVTTGSTQVTVAVVDTGIDITHPDLAGNIWTNPGENCSGCAADGVDNDHNGYVDDLHGWNFVTNSPNVADDNGHGTHVAGIIGATANNRVGIAGVSWKVRLMPLKFLGADGSGTEAAAAQAIVYATNMGARIDNASFGGGESSQALRDAIAYADAHGDLFVAAAGNDSANTDQTPSYPSSYDLPNVLSVAATDSNDQLAWFSNYGASTVDLAAPGDNILSTWPGKSYQYLSGTSMAAPQVSGAAALALAQFPQATGVGLKALLMGTADARASLAGLTVSGGRLDASTAVRCAGAPEATLNAPGPGFTAPLGQPLAIQALATVCALPGATVSATVNGVPVTLTARGDGLYSGTFTPTSAGALTLSLTASKGTASVTRSVSGIVPAPIVPGGAPVTVGVASGQSSRLSFSGSAGQRVSLQLSGVTIGSSTCCSAQVSILRPDQTTLVGATWFGTNGGYVDTTTLPTSGTYTILVEPLNGATGNATLTLYDVPADSTATITPGGPPVTPTPTTTPGQNIRATFTGHAGQRVSLELSAVTIGNSTCCGAEVSFLKPDGSGLSSPADVGTNGGFVDVQTLPVDGTYTVLLNPLGMASGTGTLRLDDVPADVSLPIVAGGPPVTPAATTVPGQNIRATFSGHAGQRVSIALSGVTIGNSTCCGSLVSILRPDGSSLSGSSFVGTSGAFVDVQTLPVDGSYTLLVDPQGTATGSATLRLYDVPADIGGAIVPGGGAVTTPSTTAPGQNIRLTFAGQANERVSLTIGTVTACCANVSIIAPSGASVATAYSVGTAGGYIDTQTLPSAGTYSVLVDPQGTTTAGATLRLFDVPSGNAAPITPGGAPVSVTVGSPPGQSARLSFSGSAGQRVSLQLSGVTIGSSTCCSAQVSILRPDQTTLVGATWFGTNGGYVDTTTLPTSGTYTILVEPLNGATGNATLTLYDVPADSTATITPGGPPVTPTPTTTPGQNIRATFTGHAGQRVSLELSAVTIGNSTCCSAAASLVEPDGTTLASLPWVGTSGGFLDVQTLPVDGTYTVLVDPTGSATGGATLRLYDVPADVGGSIVPGGQTVTTAATTAAGQNVRLTFAGQAGGRVSLTVGTVSACCANVSLVAPDGSALATAYSVGSGGSFLDAQTLPTSGTYTVLVDPQGTTSGASATLTLYDVPADSSTPIVAGDAPVTVGPSATPGQNMALTFTGAAGERVAFSVSGVTIGTASGCCSAVVSLLRPNGSSQSSAYVAGAGAFVDTQTLSAAGTYTILVDPQGPSTGAATVALFDVPADATGTLTTGGGPLTASTTVPGQNAVISFSATAGQQLTLVLSGVTIGSSSCCGSLVTIRRPDGSTQAGPVYVGSDGATIATTTLPTSGTYTVLIDPQGSATGSATLTLS